MRHQYFKAAFAFQVVPLQWLSSRPPFVSCGLSAGTWLQVMVQLMRRPVPAAAREANPWWKLRKWLLRLALRIVQRYGDPKLTKGDASKPFAQVFQTEFASPFVSVLSSPSSPHTR